MCQKAVIQPVNLGGQRSAWYVKLAKCLPHYYNNIYNDNLVFEKSPQWISVDSNDRFAAIVNVGSNHEKGAISSRGEDDVRPRDQRLVEIVAVNETAFKSTLSRHTPHISNKVIQSARATELSWFRVAIISFQQPNTNPRSWRPWEWWKLGAVNTRSGDPVPVKFKFHLGVATRYQLSSNST